NVELMMETLLETLKRMRRLRHLKLESMPQSWLCKLASALPELTSLDLGRWGFDSTKEIAQALPLFAHLHYYSGSLPGHDEGAYHYAGEDQQLQLPFIAFPPSLRALCFIIRSGWEAHARHVLEAVVEQVPQLELLCVLSKIDEECVRLMGKLE